MGGLTSKRCIAVAANPAVKLRRWHEALRSSGWLDQRHHGICFWPLWLHSALICHARLPTTMDQVIPSENSSDCRFPGAATFSWHIYVPNSITILSYPPFKKGWLRCIGLQLATATWLDSMSYCFEDCLGWAWRLPIPAMPTATQAAQKWCSFCSRKCQWIFENPHRRQDEAMLAAGCRSELRLRFWSAMMVSAIALGCAQKARLRVGREIAFFLSDPLGSRCVRPCFWFLLQAFHSGTWRGLQLMLSVCG